MYFVVLPPVPTVGLTTSDVPKLVSTVREQMLEALNEISEGHLGATSEDNGKEIDKLAQNPLDSQRISSGVQGNDTSLGIPVAKITAVDQKQVDKVEESDREADTEEDEGMILVGRPS